MSIARLVAGGVGLWLAGACALPPGIAPQREPISSADAPKVALRSPRTDGPISLETALADRRSARNFEATPPSLDQLGQILWATQGITEPERPLRAAPSAGALYPLEIDLIAIGTEGLEDGVYRYLPETHELRLRRGGDPRAGVRAAAAQQDAITQAPAVLVIWGVRSRTAARYGARASRYVHLEAGHAAQNALLQATALGLASVPIGAFNDAVLRQVLDAGPGEQPLYLLPLGRPAE